MKTNLFLIAAVLMLHESIAQSWVQKANVPPMQRHYAFGAFCYGKAYIGTGVTSGLASDFWEYDPIADTWTQRASLSSPTCETASFTVDNKVYVSGGMGQTVALREYDPLTNLWTPKANSPMTSFWGAGFAIGNKGYVYGGGTNGFSEYDPLTDSWALRAPFPVAVSYALSFSIGNKGYVGKSGAGGFYEYDPAIDVWTMKQALPGSGGSANGFAINGKGYAIVHSSPVLYQYDPLADSWTQVTVNFPAPTGRSHGVGFASADKGYFGTGISYQDFWEFTPEVTTSVNSPDASQADIKFYCDGQMLSVISDLKTLKLSLYSVGGKKIMEVNDWMLPNHSVSIKALSSGIYFCRVVGDAVNKTFKFIK